MTSIDTDCTMFDLSLAVTGLTLYIKTSKNPCNSQIDNLLENIRQKLEIKIRENDSLHKSKREIQEDFENYKLQLLFVSKSKQELELELEKVRHKNLTYEKKWESIVKDNKRLNEKAKQLEKKNSLLIDRHKNEMNKRVSAKEKRNRLHTTEKTRLKSHISDLEIQTKKYQDEIIETKLQHEKKVQEMERKVYDLQDHVHKNMKLITKNDEVITSNKRRIKDQCAEIDHLRKDMKELEIKNEFLIKEDHKQNIMSKRNQMLEKENEELSDELENVLESLCDIDMQLGTVISSLKTNTISLTTFEENNSSRYKHESHDYKTSDWNDIAYSIKIKIDHLKGFIYDTNINMKRHEDTNVCETVETHPELKTFYDLLNEKENELSKLTDENRCLQNTVEHQEVLLQQFRDELNHQDKDDTVISIENMNADLEKELEDLRDKLKMKEENALEEEKKNKKLITQMKEDIKQSMTHFEQKEAKYHQDLAQLKTELKEKEIQLSILNEQLIKEDFVKSEHVLNVQDLQNCKDRLNASEEQLNKIQNEHCQLKTKTKVIENELEKKEDELNDQKAQNDQLLSKLKESEEQIVLMAKRIREFETDDLKYKQTKTNIEKQLEYLNKSHAEKDRTISKLNETIVRSNREISDLKETERSLKSDQMNREKHISMLNNKLKENTNLVNKNESKVQDMEKTLNTEKHNYDNKVHFYENKIAQQDKIVVEINDKMGNMETHVKALGKEVKERDAKIDTLKAQLQQLQKHQDDTQKNLENIINSKQKLILNLQKDVEQRNSKISSLEKKIAQESLENLPGGEHKIDVAVTNEIKELKRQLKLTMSKLHDTEAELDDTKTRLSKAMGDRLTDNNPNITDLSDRNRPTKLAEKCAELYDNQWTDAFEILETHFPNDEAVIEALLHILQVTMTFCQNKAQHQMDELGRALTFADKNANADLSLGVYKQLKDTRKATALSAVENLRKMFISYLRHSADQTVSRALEIKDFTFECLEMCWLMMVNDPPVAFAPLIAKGTHFNSDLYKPYTYSGTHVEYVVWPALLLHEGGPILAKGVAQGINKSKKRT